MHYNEVSYRLQLVGNVNESTSHVVYHGGNAAAQRRGEAQARTTEVEMNFRTSPLL